LGKRRLAGMEKARHEKLKEALLIGFVGVCVVLIFAVWFNAFLDRGVENPYFYRAIPERSESFSLTSTVIAEQAILGTGTPTPEKKHKEATLTPTSTSVPTIPFTPESDQ
jgi:hypothetical protein